MDGLFEDVELGITWTWLDGFNSLRHRSKHSSRLRSPHTSKLRDLVH